MAERTLQIRAARPADVPALEALVESTLGECLGTVLPEDELHACAVEYRTQHGRRYYVADTDGELTGYAVIGRDSSPCGLVERLYVRHDGTAPEGERQIAAALVSALCGDREIAVPVANEAGATALELYDRWGFVDVGALRRCLSMPSGHGRLMATMAYAE